MNIYDPGTRRLTYTFVLANNQSMSCSSGSQTLEFAFLLV